MSSEVKVTSVDATLRMDYGCTSSSQQEYNTPDLRKISRTSVNAYPVRSGTLFVVYRDDWWLKANALFNDMVKTAKSRGLSVVPLLTPRQISNYTKAFPEHDDG